jgi:hypothetical protein
MKVKSIMRMIKRAEPEVSSLVWTSVALSARRLFLLNLPGSGGGSNSRENGPMNKSNKFSAEVRDCAVRMVREHRDEYPLRRTVA